MKRIAFYLSEIGTGGIESVTISHYIFMDKTNFEVEFLVDSPPSINFNVECINNLKGTIRTCFKNNNISILRKIKRPFVFIKAIRKYNYDIVHFRFSHPTSLIYALLTKLFCHSKVVVTSESQGSSNLPLSFRIICHFCSRILPFVCDFRLADSRSAGIWMFGNSSFSVMADGFDTISKKYSQVKRREIREKLGVLPGDILLGHIGRFAPEKNQTFIVDVFEIYHRTHSNAKLLLIGKGNMRDFVKAKCKVKGLIDSCIFIESVDNLDAFYSAMDIFMFPSLCEGFGMVAAEAQSASLPVLASSFVPNETCQTDFFYFEDLNAPLIKWCDDIDMLLNKRINREDVDLSNLFKNCDVRNVSNELTKIYNKLL